MTEKYSESLEMYLETILLLEKENDIVRQTDIASALGISRPSVYNSIRKLRGEKLIRVNDDSSVSLTPFGREKASNVWERHKVFARFLVNIGVDPTVAQQDACKIEHDVSEETFLRIKAWCEAHCNQALLSLDQSV